MFVGCLSPRLEKAFTSVPRPNSLGTDVFLISVSIYFHSYIL